MKKGRLITLEGVDGCGKSTQLRFLAEYFMQLGYEIVCSREPGGCPIGEEIREILLSNQNRGMSDEAEALLYAAARAEHVKKTILPALKEGKIVLCDRYIDSSLAYQGHARGLGMERILQLNWFAWEHCRPDVTFFFDYQPKAAFQRMNPNKQMDRLEQETDAFFAKVYEGFQILAAQDPARIIKIDVSGSKWETRDGIRAKIDAMRQQWI